MLRIYCPYCAEEREEPEFNYAGEAFIKRPEQPAKVDDGDWADYVFKRTNTKGWQWEQWVHSAGCRKFFLVERNTIDHSIRASQIIANNSK